MNIEDLAIAARNASIHLAACQTDLKNTALSEIARALDTRREDIVKANADDLARSEEENLSAPLMKRLKFDEKKIDGVIEGIESLITLPDPVGTT